MIKLLVPERRFIPEAARSFFPSPIDGYLYLLDDESGYECRRFMYGDSHPWKDYSDSDHFVESLTKAVGDNLIASVAAWNAAANAAQEKEAAARQSETERIQQWLETLPKMIARLEVCDGLLMDEWGNEMFDLCAHQFRYKDVSEIEQKIEELLNDGYEPE